MLVITKKQLNNGIRIDDTYQLQQLSNLDELNLMEYLVYSQQS